MPDDFLRFKQQIAPRVKLDLDQYKPRQMERRIRAMMTRANLPTLDAYGAWLEADPDRLRDFIDGLTINVSEFFRNPEKFAELERQVLPGLLARFERLRIWSAGCSSGAELASTAILLDRLGALERADLIGTDFDRAILERAQDGLYPPHETRNLTAADRERYFSPIADRSAEPGTLRLNAELRAHLTYQPHDLLAAPPLAPCHLILCRNVVIYFTQESKDKLYRGFYQALHAGGMLFIGGTERILDFREIGFQQPLPFFYQKP